MHHHRRKSVEFIFGIALLAAVGYVGYQLGLQDARSQRGHWQRRGRRRG